MEKKQIPYRYSEEQESQLNIMYALQWSTTKKNQAINDALEIASTITKKILTSGIDMGFYDKKDKVLNLISNLDHKMISKLTGKK